MFLFIGLICFCFCAPKAPLLPVRYACPYTETIKAEKMKKSFDGIKYYDSSLNKSLTINHEGNVEALCYSARLFSDAECHQHVDNDMRYLYWPDTNSCCFCVKTGILYRDMVQRFGEYQGTIDWGKDQKCDKWLLPGPRGFLNIAGKETPCGLADSVMGIESSIVFHTDKISYERQPASRFELPSVCNSQSPDCIGVCAFFRTLV